MSTATNDVERNQTVSQWIVSLAVSVICCAVLFLIGANYIYNLNEKATVAMVKVEFLEARQEKLVSELDALRRPIPVTTTAPAVAPVAAPADSPATTPAEGAPSAPAATDEIIPPVIGKPVPVSPASK